MYAGPHDGPVYQQGAVITAICDPGYLLNGPAERECIADGVWSGINSTCNLGQLNDACFYPNLSIAFVCIRYFAEKHYMNVVVAEPRLFCLCHSKASKTTRSYPFGSMYLESA